MVEPARAPLMRSARAVRFAALGIAAATLYFGGGWILDFDGSTVVKSQAKVQSQSRADLAGARVAINPKPLVASPEATTSAASIEFAAPEIPVAVAAPALAGKAAPTVFTTPTATAVPALFSPFTYVGAVRTEGGPTVALSSGERVIFVRQGDTVDRDYRLITLDPPTLLHEPSGTRLIVRAKPDAALVPPTVLGAASPTAPTGTRPAAQSLPAFNATDVAAIEAEVDRALAALPPPPPPLVASSFPLAR